MERSGAAGHIHQPANIGAQGCSGRLMDLVTMRSRQQLGITGHQSSRESSDPGQAPQNHVVIV